VGYRSDMNERQMKVSMYVRQCTYKGSVCTGKWGIHTATCVHISVYTSGRLSLQNTLSIRK
jgi:hypothetical protein